MKNWLAYLFLVAGTGYLLVMYAAEPFLLLLLLELIFPLLQLFLLPVQRLGLRTRMEGEAENFRLLVENRGVLPLLRLAVRTEVLHPWSGQRRRRWNRFSVGGRDTQEIRMNLGQLPCGRTVVTAERLRLWDYLGLFFLVKRLRVRREFCRFPKLLPAEVAVSGRTWSFRMDGDVFSDSQPGDDPAEVFGFREYQPGDRLQQVHWKLSARADSWVVRELSLPEIPRILLLADLRRPAGATAAQCDAFLTSVLSLSQALVLEGCCHELGWYQPQTGKLQRKRVQDLEQLYEAGEQLMRADLYPEAEDLWEVCRSERLIPRYAGILRVNLELELYYGEALVGKLSAEHLEQDLARCGLEV